MQCKCVRHIPQAERQRHLLRDKDINLKRIQQEALRQVSLAPSSHNAPAELADIDMDVDGTAFPDPPLPEVPSSLPSTYPDATAPDPPVHEPNPPQPEIFGPSQDLGIYMTPDGWEDADSADEEDVQTPPPARSPTPSTLAASDPAPITNTTVTPSSTLVRQSRPVAWGVPVAKSQENTPDPFELRLSIRPTKARHTDETLATGLDLLYVLATWLHVQFHLPFRACTALVKIVILIIKSYGALITNDPISTLPRIMSRIDVEPTIFILPICPECLEVYPESEATPTTCRCCNAFLFKSNSPHPQVKEKKRTPLLGFPYKSILSSLTEILAVPGVEDELDRWRTVERQPGFYADIFDGEITRSLQCPDGSLFFQNEPGNKTGPGGVLRIGVTLGVDW